MSDTEDNYNDEEEYIKMYKEQLSEIENIVLEIAINNLETSFDIVKSIGYIEWKEEYLITLNS